MTNTDRLNQLDDRMIIYLYKYLFSSLIHHSRPRSTTQSIQYNSRWLTRSSPIRLSPTGTFAIGERPLDFHQCTPCTLANCRKSTEFSPMHIYTFANILEDPLNVRQYWQMSTELSPVYV